jgi:hypothetical protein
MTFSILSSNKIKFNNNLLYFSMAPTRTFASNSGENLDGDQNQAIVVVAPTETSITTIQNDNELTTTDSANVIIAVSYKDLCKVENLELGLKRTKSGVSPGLDGEIKANYTTGKLEKLAEELRTHKYKASPIKKV